MKKPTLGDVLTVALVLVQCAFLLAVTFAAGGATLDGDAAKVCANLRGVWEQGRLILQDWVYPTTMELDCALLFALPFYGLTGDPVLALHLADGVLVFAWAGVVWLLCRRLGARRGTAALAVLLVLAPWRFGMLDYWNMLFLNAAQYSFKVLLPLLLFALLLARRPRAGDWLLAAFCLAGIGLTGLSSGVYTAACGLAPVLLWFFWRCWRQACRPSAYQGVCAGGAVLATGAGLWANAAFGAAAKGDSMTLVGAADFVTNAANCLVGFWRLFGGIPDGETPVEALSLAGVTTLLRAGLAAALIWAAVRAVRGLRRWRRRLPDGAGCLVWMFGWNLAVLLLTDTRYGDPLFEYRYHLMGAVPLLILLAITLGRLPATLVRLPARLLAAGAVLAVVVLADAGAVGAIWQPDGTVGVTTPQRQLVDALDESGIEADDVFVDYEAGGAEICAALDGRRRYVILESGCETTIVYDGPRGDADASSYGAPSVLALKAGQPLSERAPAWLAAQYQYLARAGGYDLYACTGRNLLDGSAGLGFGSEGVDYCNSRGYICNGTVDTDRRLHAQGAGVVVESDALPVHCDAVLTLEYEIVSGAGGTLRARQGGEVVAETRFTGRGEVQLDLPAGETALEIELDPDTEATIGRLIFRKR